MAEAEEEVEHGYSGLNKQSVEVELKSIVTHEHESFFIEEFIKDFNQSNFWTEDYKDDEIVDSSNNQVIHRLNLGTLVNTEYILHLNEETLITLSEINNQMIDDKIKGRSLLLYLPYMGSEIKHLLSKNLDPNNGSTNSSTLETLRDLFSANKVYIFDFDKTLTLEEFGLKDNIKDLKLSAEIKQSQILINVLGELSKIQEDIDIQEECNYSNFFGLTQKNYEQRDNIKREVDKLITKLYDEDKLLLIKKYFGEERLLLLHQFFGILKKEFYPNPIYNLEVDLHKSSKDEIYVLLEQLYIEKKKKFCKYQKKKYEKYVFEELEKNMNYKRSSSNLDEEKDEDDSPIKDHPLFVISSLNSFRNIYFLLKISGLGKDHFYHNFILSKSFNVNSTKYLFLYYCLLSLKEIVYIDDINNSFKDLEYISNILHQLYSEPLEDNENFTAKTLNEIFKFFHLKKPIDLKFILKFLKTEDFIKKYKLEKIDYEKQNLESGELNGQRPPLEYKQEIQLVDILEKDFFFNNLKKESVLVELAKTHILKKFNELMSF